MTIITQNVRSLRNKLHVLRAHAPELSSYDVIAITETWLTDETLDSELQHGIKSHVWFRRDRQGHGGGVACAVRSTLSPARREDLEADDTETLMLELKTSPGLILAVCYCKPAPDRGVLERTLLSLKSAIIRHPNRRIVAVGDFNLPTIKWSLSGLGSGLARAIRWSDPRHVPACSWTAVLWPASYSMCETTDSKNEHA